MNSGKYPWLVGVVVGALLLLLPLTGAWGSTPVANLILRGEDGFTELVVPGAARLLCDHSSQEPTDKHPFRIVLDFCDANHALGQQTFDALPATVVSRIRSSQYALTPQQVVRVVLDLRKSATYTVNAVQNDLVVKVVDPDRASFAVWQANTGGNTTLAKKTETTVTPKTVATTAAPAKTPEAPAGEKVASTTPVSKPTKATPSTTSIKSTPSPTSTKSMASTPITPPTKPAVSTPAPLATTTPPEPKSTPPTPPAVITPAPVATTTPPEPKSTPTTPSTKPAVITPAPLATTTPPEPKSTPSMTSTPSTPSEYYPTETKSTPGFVVPKRPLVLAPEYLESEAPSEKVQVAQVSMTPFGPNPPATAATTEGETPALATTTTLPLVSKKTATPKPGDTTTGGPQETLFERLRTKFLSEQTPPRPYQAIDLPVSGAVIGDSGVAETYGPPAPSTMLTREELLARVRQAAASAGLTPDQAAGEPGLVSSTNLPPRENVIYDDMGRRDPFAPLVKGLHSGFVSDQLPSVENLRLVGVLRDDHEALALFENQEGYGYVLHVGDRVENGIVAAIEENRVLFRVQDYGWTHVVALQLTSRGADPSKALGLKSPAQSEYQDNSQYQQVTPPNTNTNTNTNTNQAPKPEGVNP